MSPYRTPARRETAAPPVPGEPRRESDAWIGLLACAAGLGPVLAALLEGGPWGAAPTLGLGLLAAGAWLLGTRADAALGRRRLRRS